MAMCLRSAHYLANPEPARDTLGLQFQFFDGLVLPLLFRRHQKMNASCPSSMANATNGSLTLTGVTQTDLGAYQVCVTNAIGSVWSLRANLLPEAPLHFSSRRMVENGFHLAVYGTAGTNYAIDCSTNIANWVPLHTNRTQTGLFDYIDSSATTNVCAFYRIRPVP